MQARFDHASDTRPHDAVTLILTTYVCLKGYWLVSAFAGRMLDVVSFEALIKLAVWLPICGLIVWLIYRRAGPPPRVALGLGPGLLRGIGFGLAATLPMALGILLLPNKPIDPDLVVGSAMIGPLAEEVLFRGFLFTLLVRRAGWSVPAALCVSSILFGLAHVRNVDLDLLTIVRGPDPANFEPTFRADGSHFHLVSGYEVWWRHLTTRLPAILLRGLPYAGGGAVFAWITYRWKSLWPAIGLHGFMNFWWDLTNGEHAQLVFRLDPLAAAQALSVIVAVCLTILWTGRARLVMRRSLWSP